MGHTNNNQDQLNTVNNLLSADTTNILAWNAQDISNKKIPITILTGTQLKPDKCFSSLNHLIYRMDRLNRSDGDTAIIINKNIKHEDVILPILIQLKPLL